MGSGEQGDGSGAHAQENALRPVGSFRAGGTPVGGVDSGDEAVVLPGDDLRRCRRGRWPGIPVSRPSSTLCAHDVSIRSGDASPRPAPVSGVQELGWEGIDARRTRAGQELPGRRPRGQLFEP